MRPTNDQPTTNQTTDQATDGRVTVPEAAVILGLSEDAVRSRLKRGTLAKEKGRDGTVFVVLGSDKTTGQPTPGGDQPLDDQTFGSNQPMTGQPTDQSTLVEVLSDQVSFLRQQLDEEREANRENRRIIAGLVQRVPPELEAAPESRESPERVSDEGIRAVKEAPKVFSKLTLSSRSRLLLLLALIIGLAVAVVLSMALVRDADAKENKDQVGGTATFALNADKLDGMDFSAFLAANRFDSTVWA